MQGDDQQKTGEVYLQSILVLEKQSPRMQHVAKITEHKITSKNQLVAEMGETCSTANGQARIDQTQKKSFNEENLDEKKAMDEKIKKEMKELKDKVRNIEEVQEEFAKLTNNLPGVIKTLGTAAIKNVSSACGSACSFVHKGNRENGQRRIFWTLFHLLETV